jgi:hypothetical protein
MDEATQKQYGHLVLDLCDESIAQANYIRSLEARIDQQLELINQLKSDYAELVKQAKRQTGILREIKNRQDRDDWWRQ